MVVLRILLLACLVCSLVLPNAALPADLMAEDRPGAEASSIRGVVVDSANGERILGASVMLEGTKLGAATNTNGFYLIPSVPPGTYQLTASAVGYGHRTIRVTVSGSEPMTVDIKLSLQVIEYREIIVRSADILTLTERSASVHIVTPKELHQIPSVAQPDVLRSLQMLPGITSTSDVSAKFYVRGGAGDQNLILLDGMKVYNPFHAFGLFSILDPDIVRNAEVYTGAFPAGYGGRLSSVVNVVTKDGNLSKISGIANINFLSGKLELDGPIMGDNSWLISARSSLFSNTINKIIPNPAPTTFYDLFFKGTIGTSTGRIGFRGYTSGDDVEPTDPLQPNHSWRNAAVSMVVSSLATEFMYVDASLSYSRSEIKRIPKPFSTVLPQHSTLEEVSLRCEATSFTENQNTFFEGFELIVPSITDSLYSSSGYPSGYNEKNVDFYAWLRFQGKIGSWGFDLGVHSDITLLLNGAPIRQGLQPRVTLSYDIDGNWRVKASYGIFTQKLITISNEDELISLFDAWVYLPPELQPEEAQHFVAGIDGSIVPALATSVQAYLKTYNSITLYNAAKLFPQDPDYVSGTGIAYGAEGLLRFTSSLLDLYGSYAWSLVNLTHNNMTYAPRYDRRHAIKALATLHITETLDATVRWEYGSGYPFTQSTGLYARLPLSDLGTTTFPGGTGNPYATLGPKNASRLPAYHRMDVGVSYNQTVGMFKIILGASIINVYDAKNILYYDRITGKTDYMTPFLPTASFTLEF